MNICDLYAYGTPDSVNIYWGQPPSFWMQEGGHGHRQRKVVGKTHKHTELLWRLSLSLCLRLRLSVCLSFCVCVCVCLSVCLSLSLSLSLPLNGSYLAQTVNWTVWMNLICWAATASVPASPNSQHRFLLNIHNELTM